MKVSSVWQLGVKVETKNIAFSRRDSTPDICPAYNWLESYGFIRGSIHEADFSLPEASASPRRPQLPQLPSKGISCGASTQFLIWFDLVATLCKADYGNETKFISLRPGKKRPTTILSNCACQCKTWIFPDLITWCVTHWPEFHQKLLWVVRWNT